MIQLTGINGKNKDLLYVFFTARKLEGFAVDNFHWIPVAKKLDCPAYFLRDTSNSFYRGLQIAPFLRVLRPIIKSQETIFVGSSMGAYGAILWGQRLKPSKVIAFTPAPPKKDTLHELTDFPPIDIHVCKDSKWRMTNEYNDVENAELYRQHAKIFYHDGDKHNVAAVLREQGKLDRIICGED